MGAQSRQTNLDTLVAELSYQRSISLVLILQGTQGHLMLPTSVQVSFSGSHFLSFEHLIPSSLIARLVVCDHHLMIKADCDSIVKAS